MLYLFVVFLFSNKDCNVIVPGCLAHPSDKTCTALMHTLATAKHKVELTAERAFCIILPQPIHFLFMKYAEIYSSFVVGGSRWN